MHKYEKISLMECRSLTELPSLKHMLHTVDCPNCHWCQPVPLEYTDWKSVAETYEQAYKDMATTFFKKLDEAGKQFDVPLVEYFDADRQIMLAELRQIIARLGGKG
jgi:cyclopropane fatty-acyl-phospholipid synthase-like methyltransferase